MEWIVWWDILFIGLSFVGFPLFICLIVALGVSIFDVPTSLLIVTICMHLDMFAVVAISGNAWILIMGMGMLLWGVDDGF